MEVRPIIVLGATAFDLVGVSVTIVGSLIVLVQFARALVHRQRLRGRRGPLMLRTGQQHAQIALAEQYT